MTDKHHPEMIPKPYKNEGMPDTLSAIPLTFFKGLTGQKNPKNDTETIHKTPPITPPDRNGRKEPPCHE